MGIKINIPSFPITIVFFISTYIFLLYFGILVPVVHGLHCYSCQLHSCAGPPCHKLMLNIRKTEFNSVFGRYSLEDCSPTHSSDLTINEARRDDDKPIGANYVQECSDSEEVCTHYKLESIISISNNITNEIFSSTMDVYTCGPKLDETTNDKFIFNNHPNNLRNFEMLPVNVTIINSSVCQCTKDYCNYKNYNNRTINECKLIKKKKSQQDEQTEPKKKPIYKPKPPNNIHIPASAAVNSAAGSNDSGGLEFGSPAGIIVGVVVICIIVGIIVAIKYACCSVVKQVMDIVSDGMELGKGMISRLMNRKEDDNNHQQF